MISKVVHKKSNITAGSASYGMTDTMGRMHSDAHSSFAPRQNKWICSALGLSSVPAHVEMMVHTNTRMTNHYAKIVDKYIGEEMDKLCDMLV